MLRRVLFSSVLRPTRSSVLNLKRRRFFCIKPTQEVMTVAGSQSDKTGQSLNETSLMMKDGKKIEVKFNDHTVCYELPERIGGTTYDTHGQYMIMFTCKKCDTKQSKFFTKNAYHQGVVLIRCEGCSAFHLIADNLGWFSDDKINIETIMKEKNENLVIGQADSELLNTLSLNVKKTRTKFEEDQKVRQAKQQEEENNKQSVTSKDQNQ